MVPTLSIIFICCTLLFVILVSIILPVFIKKKWQTAVFPYFLGWAAFFVFALVLESILHLIVLGADGKSLSDNMWLYALYGGFAAGIFEETGRLTVMKLFMKKQYGNPHNALMYGAGHGCFEALALIGMSMAGNLVVSMLINAGQTDMLLNALQGEQKEAMENVMTQLKETASFMFLLSGFERITAIMLHISLSVLVWTAVVKKKPLFFFLAGMSTKPKQLHSFDDWKKYISKTILALVVPYVIFAFIYAPFSFDNVPKFLYGSWHRHMVWFLFFSHWLLLSY